LKNPSSNDEKVFIGSLLHAVRVSLQMESKHTYWTQNDAVRQPQKGGKK
jgi:hypothetical protein